MEIEGQGNISDLAERVLEAARSNVIISMRFMDASISHIKAQERQGLLLPRCDGRILNYDARDLLLKTKNDNAYATRLYLHVLFHYIFAHQYFYNKIDDERKRELFSLACDIAIESVVLSLNIPQVAMSDDVRREDKIRVLAKYVEKFTAHAIYKYFLANDLSQDGERELKELFVFDDNTVWMREEINMTQTQWQKMAERVKADLKTFSKDAAKSAGLIDNLERATKQRYDYNSILRKFMITGESMTTSSDEFDYIYYTLGLRMFGNLPLVEPLETKEEKRIKDFAIVLDTSASCKGNIIKAFLQRTYDIMKSQNSFFDEVNIHIIQCDNMVHQDTLVRNDDEFEEFLNTGKLQGFGGTDFRPAFEYVQNLIDEGYFRQLKGIVYFTDGYGIYPDYTPAFECMFAFLDEDANRQPPPPWAIKVVLEQEEFDEH